MEEFRTMCQLQLQLFTLLGIGYFLGKKKCITIDGRQCMTDIFINVILPCNIITSFQVDFSKEIFKKILCILIISFAIQFFCLLLSRVLYGRVEDEERKVLQYATICSNSGFMGNPIVEGVYGTMGLLYTSAALIPIRIFMWSAGLSLFTVTNGKKVLKQLITHPCILAVEIGIGLMVTGWKMPFFLEKSISALGNCVTPISMLIIGSILAGVSLKSLFEKNLLYYSALRLIVIPYSVMIILRIFHCDELLTGVSVLLAAMPAASTTAILAERYKGNAEYASKCVLVSTLLSVITLPIISLGL